MPSYVLQNHSIPAICAERYPGNQGAFWEIIAGETGLNAIENNCLAVFRIQYEQGSIIKSIKIRFHGDFEADGVEVFFGKRAIGNEVVAWSPIVNWEELPVSTPTIPEVQEITMAPETLETDKEYILVVRPQITVNPVNLYNVIIETQNRLL